MANITRYCAFDDKLVRAVSESKGRITEDGVIGKGTPAHGFYHIQQPNCGRQFLEEHQTYTEQESDLNPPSR